MDFRISTGQRSPAYSGTAAYTKEQLPKTGGQYSGQCSAFYSSLMTALSAWLTDISVTKRNFILCYTLPFQISKFSSTG